MADAAPSRLGKYELITRLATGGMAEILLARQHGLGQARRVVVKRLLPHLAEKPRFVDMFIEEARLSALVHHSNVVQVFDVGEDGGDYYIAMEHIDGLTVAAMLRAALRRGERIPFARSAELVAQACDGLHAAHELRDDDGQALGLVHRDVSPQNLMVTRDGTVKVVDFGIAKARDRTVRTRTGAIMGKEPYLSPEQCRGETLDRRSDLFALGTVFFELLTGERLFARETELWTLKAITEEPIPSPRDLDPEVPDVLDAIVIAAHQRNREDRWPDAQSMGSAIRAALTALSPSGPDLGSLVRRYATVGLDEVEVDDDELLTTPSTFDSVSPARETTTSSELQLPTRTDEEPPTRAPRPDRLLQGLLAGFVAAAVVALAALWWSPSPGPSRPAGPAIVVTSPPYYGRQDTTESLAPLARYLEGRLDRRVEIRVAESYDATVESLLSGEAHVATLSPLPWVQAHAREPRLQLLAAQTFEGARSYQSYIVTRDGSRLASIEDLRGRSFCYVDRSSTSGYLLPRHALRERGYDPESFLGETRESGSHDEVMRDVLAGRCEAGAIYSGALLSAGRVGVPTSRIRMLAVVGRSPRGVLCATPSLPADLTARFRQALLDFDPRRDLGRDVLSDVLPIDGFVATSHADFAEIESAARAEGLFDRGPAR